MRPLGAAAAAALGVALWLGVVAPALSARLEAARAETQATAGVAQIASAVLSARRSLLPTGAAAEQAAAALQEGALALEVERTWTARAAAALNPSQRGDPGPAPDLPRSRRLPWLDPELPALLDALGARFGFQVVEPPDAPRHDPWPGVEPRRRLAALRALAPALTEAQAHAVAGLALEAALAQRRRAEAEAALRQTLDPAVLALAARLPGDPAHVSGALDLLALRSGAER